MNSKRRQYIFGSLFVLIGAYMGYTRDMVEMALYCFAGLAFVVNAMTFEQRLWAYKKTLVYMTWALIIISAILFLYVLQFNF